MTNLDAIGSQFAMPTHAIAPSETDTELSSNDEDSVAPHSCPGALERARQSRRSSKEEFSTEPGVDSFSSVDPLAV